MIEINKYKHNTITIYSPNGSILIDNCEEFTLLDIQCQIAEQKLKGYSYSFNGQKGTIDEKGQLSDWFWGMFDLHSIFYARLFSARMNRNSFTAQDAIDKMKLI